MREISLKCPPNVGFSKHIISLLITEMRQWQTTYSSDCLGAWAKQKPAVICRWLRYQDNPSIPITQTDATTSDLRSFVVFNLKTVTKEFNKMWASSRWREFNFLHLKCVWNIIFATYWQRRMMIIHHLSNPMQSYHISDLAFPISHSTLPWFELWLSPPQLVHQL